MGREVREFLSVIEKRVGTVTFSKWVTDLIAEHARKYQINDPLPKAPRPSLFNYIVDRIEYIYIEHTRENNLNKTDRNDEMRYWD